MGGDLVMDPYQELTLYQRSAVLMAAARLGVFSALLAGPATAVEVARRTALPAGPASRLLSALRASGYVAFADGAYALNDVSSAFTRDGAGGMQRLAWKEHVFYGAWGRLADAVSSGAPLFASFPDRVAHDFASVEKFLLALNDLAQAGAPGVIGTGAFTGAATILDLGGGGGGYAAELCRSLPDARITLADLPGILPIAEGHLGSKGLEGHVELVAADFHCDGCGLGGRTFDCVFLSHILHDFDAATARAIVGRAARLVGPGGRLVILDVLEPDGGHVLAMEALFDLMMLVEVPRGRTHGISEVAAWIEAEGLGTPVRHKLYFGILLEARAE